MNPFNYAFTVAYLSESAISTSQVELVFHSKRPLQQPLSLFLPGVLPWRLQSHNFNDTAQSVQ